MIKYSLKCNKSHEFEAWFSNSAACEKQVKRGLVACPDCGSVKVAKALMAPSVSTRRRRDVEPAAAAPSVPAEPVDPRRAEMQRELLTLMRKVRQHVEQNSDYVGPRFAEEARKMHHNETEPRGIYGEASLAEAKELHEEGIDILPLPPLPEDAN